jgi:hypothetical protein
VASAPSEAEVLVGELESRVDRLRSLYDQYFCGLEKLEPTVPKKDVERRMAHLRKVNLRNTALRFRFNTAVQRYNTYLSHWQRICRQIEEGTYKRDVRRAQERFGPNATAASARARRRGAASSIELSDVDFEEDLDMEEFSRSAMESESDELETLRPAAQPGRQAAVAIPPAPAAPRFPGMETMPTPAPQSGSRPRTIPPELPQRAVAQMQQARAAASGDHGPALVPAPPGIPGMREVSDDPYARQMRREAATGTRAIPVPFAPVTSVNQTHAVPRIQPTGTITPQPRTQHPVAYVPAPRPGFAGGSGVGSGIGSSNGGGGGGGGAGPRPDLSDDRVRQLYKQYVEAKRSRQESTAAITFDGLARSLRDSSEKLKQKHGDKQVDFEVAVKDGKTILRPVVK